MVDDYIVVFSEELNEYLTTKKEKNITYLLIFSHNFSFFIFKISDGI